MQTPQQELYQTPTRYESFEVFLFFASFENISFIISKSNMNLPLLTYVLWISNHALCSVTSYLNYLCKYVTKLSLPVVYHFLSEFLKLRSTRQSGME